MGMYNEVWKICPDCGGKGYMQIAQIVLGFGNFDLDKPSTLSDLSIGELQELKDSIQDEKFYCENCNAWFDYKANNEDEKTKLIKELCNGNDEIA